MGADLNNIVKCQALSDEHVQFLVYQLLRGLKVGEAPAGGARSRGGNLTLVLPLAVHPLSGDHPPGRCRGVRVGPLQDPRCALLRSQPTVLQDLKPSNVAVNEDCELRVSPGGGGAEGRGFREALTPGACSRSWTSGWRARLTRR